MAIGDKITDTPGLSTWEQMNGIKVDDKLYSPAEIAKSPALQSVATGRADKVYDAEGGGFTTDPLEAKYTTEMSIDDKTGKITVKAPKVFTDSASYKENILPALQTISQNYKLNPDYKYALMNGSEDTKTSKEWLEDINKDLPQMVSQRVALDQAKQQVKQDTGLDLSDEQIIKRLSIALDRTSDGQVMKVTDDTMQSLPERIKNLRAFQNLANWDKDSHQVSWGDLSKVWSREKTSDEDLIQVFNEVDNYFREGDFSDLDEYAEMEAFREFINGKDPETGFWRGVGDVVSNIAYGVITGAVKFDMDVLNAIEGAMNILPRNHSSLLPGPEIPDNFVRDYLQPELENLVKAHQTNSMRLNDAAGTIYGISNALTPILMQISVGNALGKAAVSKISGAASKLIAGTGEAHLVGAAEGMTAQQVATAALNGTNFLLRTASAQVANGMVAGAIKTLQTYQKVAGSVMTIADVGAQIVVDCAVSDSKLFRQFLEGDVDDETKAYLVNQMVQNAAGWGLGIVAGKVLTAAAKTDTAKVINAAVSPKISKWKARIGDYTDKIKTNLLHGGDANWNATKAQKLTQKLQDGYYEGGKRIRLENQIGAAERRQKNLTQRRITRVADKDVGKLDGPFKGAESWQDVVQNAQDIKLSADVKYTAAQLFANHVYTQDVSSKVAQITLDNVKLGGAQNDYLDVLQKVLKQESVDGLVKSSKVMDLDGNRVIGAISKESNEYALGMYRLQVANDTKALYLKAGKSVKPIDDEIAYYTKYIEDFRQNHSEELVGLLDDLEKKGLVLSGATQDARVAEGVLDADSLEEVRGSGYFSQGYMRTQRTADWDTYQKRGGELYIGKLKEDQHLVWGLGEDGKPREFQDITFTLFDDINQMAKQSIRKEMMGYLDELGVKSTLVVSGDEVKAAKTVNGITQEKVFKEIDRNIANFTKDTDDAVFEQAVDAFSAKGEIRTAEAAVMDAGAGTIRAKVAPVKVSDRKISRTIMSNKDLFTDDVVAAMVEENLGKTFSQLDETEFNAIMESLSEKDRQVFRGLLREASATDTSVGLITKKQLPLIKTSDWKKATGLSYKDAGALKPYLSESRGVTIDEALDNIRDYSGLPPYDENQSAWTELSEIYDRVLSRSTSASGKITYDAFTDLVKNRPDVATKMESVMNRRLVAGNFGNVWDDNDKLVHTMIEDSIRQKRIFDAETLYSENIKKLNDLKLTYNLPELETDLTDQMEQFIDNIIENNRKSVNVTKSLEALDAGDVDDMVEYATLKRLAKNKKTLRTTGDKLETHVANEWNKILTARNKTVVDGKVVEKFTEAEINKIAYQYGREAKDWFESEVIKRYGEVANRLKDSGSEIVDQKALFGKIDEINKEIAGAQQAKNIVKTYSDAGMEEYVELSPTVADLITTMPTPIRRSTFGEIQQNLSKVFRMGTTGGLNPASLIRQGFRDTGNAVVMGNMTRSSAEVERVLTESFGGTVADYYQKNMPGVWDTLLKQSEETGESVEKLAVQRELSRASTSVDAELESNLYRFTKQNRIARNADGVYDQSVFDNMSDKFEKFYNKTEKLNIMRETNLRVGVYKNAYLDALSNGHSVPMARKYAEMIQAEATTNFGRQSYHLANLTHTVPYLGSAINGSKSFWRLYSLDPAGVTFRIMAGYVTPMIALTNMSMGTPENLEVYKQIPEYEKADNLIFVLNGQKFSIPVPQEIASFIAPLRSMIETMHGANDHSFNELMANNLVGFSPLNLEGFVNIDSDRILSDNENGDIWQDHLLPGFSKLASSMMPPLVKSGVMYATGYDPYTGKKIDTSYVAVDPETGEQTVMDYKSGELAKMLGNIFGDVCSAPMAQAILNNLLGTNNMDIIDGLSEIAVSVPSEEGVLSGVTKAATRLGENITGPLYSPDYGEQSNLAWNRAVSQLYQEKAAILNNESYQADVKALNSGKLSETAANAAKSRINTMKEQYQQKVLTATKNLVKEYGGTLDRNKFGSVLSLMIFTKDDVDYNENPLAAQQDSEEYKLARAQAVETMAKMGFDSPNDHSMFGYYKQDKDTGEIGIEYYSPLSILNFNYSTGLNDDVALANIRNAVNDDGLWTQHESMREQLNNIYDSKTKLTDSDYAKIEAIQINWNAQVAKTIAPYLSKMTAESALNNTQVLNYLKPLIEVPSSWGVNNKGRYVSLGDRGSKKDAYYQSWIKSMFSVNDKYKGQY